MPRNKVFIPLGPTQAIVAPTLTMQPPHTPEGSYRWEARGKQVRFRMGIMEGIREGTIDQPAFDALPESIRALTREEMVANTKKQALTGANAPLKLTERQLIMFENLASNAERRRFDVRGVEGGQRLPSGLWDSQSSTQQIWLTMIKRGVLEIVNGSADQPYSRWLVNPGPRFQEAVSLLLDSDVLGRGSRAHEVALEVFRPGQGASTSAPKRLRSR